MAEKKLSDLKNEFLQHMDEILKKDDFVRKKGGQDYHKVVSDNLSLTIHFTFVTHPKIDFDVCVDVEVAHKKVQELLFGWRKDMTPRKIKETATYGYEIGQLAGGYPLRWTVNSQTDLKSVAEEVYRAIVRIGYPFHDKYSDLKKILENLYSSNPKDWKADRDSRAELVPIIEILLGEKDKGIESFKRFYKELSEKNAEFYKENYLPLIRYVTAQFNIPSPV